MKRPVLFIFTLLCFINVMAQDLPLAGTWEGTLSMPIPDANSDGMRGWQYKVIIRIKQYDENYVVRMKHVPVEEPSKVKYFDNITVLNASPTSLAWSCDTGESYDCDWNANGQAVDKTEYSYRCCVEYSKGRLLYSYYMHSIYKSKNGRIIGTHDTPLLGKTHLYKEEADW